VPVGDAVEHAAYRRGRTEEEGAADAVDGDIGIGARRRVVGRAGRIVCLVLGNGRQLRGDCRALRHAVEEEHRPEREADDDRLGETDEDRKQERCEKDDGIAA
jgi:hypothetical protein